MVLVLVPARGPNKERPGPQPCHSVPCAVAKDSRRFKHTIEWVSRIRVHLWGSIETKWTERDQGQYKGASLYTYDVLWSNRSQWLRVVTSF